jgi:hypothetical protein
LPNFGNCCCNAFCGSHCTESRDCQTLKTVVATRSCDRQSYDNRVYSRSQYKHRPPVTGCLGFWRRCSTTCFGLHQAKFNGIAPYLRITLQHQCHVMPAFTMHASSCHATWQHHGMVLPMIDHITWQPTCHCSSNTGTAGTASDSASYICNACSFQAATSWL